MDLYEELQRITRLLDVCIKQLRKNGVAYAQAQKDYNIILRQESLKLRAEGMAVGMIQLIVKGIPTVADARFKRDAAEETLTANKEAINFYKLQQRLIEGQINREWGASGRGDL